MMETTEDSIWCDLASQWIASNGLEDLDALQRARFLDHSARCQHCSSLLPQVAWSESPDAESIVDWPHLADETLRVLVLRDFSQAEERLIQTLVEPHLEICDDCATRFEAMQEWPEIPEFREAVVGRAVSVPIHWTNNQAELSWVIDQVAIGMSVWRVSLALSSGLLETTLSVEGKDIANQWTFSLLLATDEEFLPTVVLDPASLTVRSECKARTMAKWRATPIITMPLPQWSKLVCVGQEPATMVSLDDAERRELALTVPYEGAVNYREIAPWLNTLLVDLRGERLECRLNRSDDDRELAGIVTNKRKQLVGNWRLRVREGALINLVVTPESQKIIRFATLMDDDVPVGPSIDSAKENLEFEHQSAPIYQWLDRKKASPSWSFNSLRWLQRFIDIRIGQFQAQPEFAPVLGSATREYELDLSPVLKEVELDRYFENFTLIIREENQVRAAVKLVPLKPLEGISERPLILETQILGFDGQPLGERPMILRLGTQTSSRSERLKGSFDLDAFAGKVKITIREVPPAPSREDNE